MNERIRDLGALVLCVGVSIANFLIFGLNHIRSWKDAQQYSTFASNLISGHGYSLDGSTFSTFREPGYPFFLAVLYRIFGNENILAVCFIQSLLLGVLGFLIYKTFEDWGYWKYGLAAALCISGLPFYGFYTNEVVTELFYAFLLGVTFFICARIAQRRGSAWYWFMFLGALCGYTSLVRFQFVLFLPFIIVVSLLLRRSYPPNTFRNILIACVTAMIIIGPWVLYVHKETGKFTVTDGRQEESLYARAVRAQLSYSDLTRYLKEWVVRSISGGTGETEFLYRYEFKYLYSEYHRLAPDDTSAKKIQQEDIHAFITHPGTYLYSTLIEAIKLAYIEHDYSDSTNRYLRASIYVLIYALFVFGFISLVLKRGELRLLGCIALTMLTYNFLVLSPFADVIPRLNTPYLMFYIIMGFIGAALFRSDYGRLRA